MVLWFLSGLPSTDRPYVPGTGSGSELCGAPGRGGGADRGAELLELLDLLT